MHDICNWMQSVGDVQTIAGPFKWVFLGDGGGWGVGCKGQGAFTEWEKEAAAHDGRVVNLDTAYVHVARTP